MMTRSELAELIKAHVRKEIKRKQRLTDKELAAIIASTVNGLIKRAA